ncbi:hypothetical protein [Streptomyces sp. cg36]|uniref:hypothetical protein n=1 Tax=Streptomyces sp. cg36 TaxID=3238798 RepID=UPI0034E2F1C0
MGASSQERLVRDGTTVWRHQGAAASGWWYDGPGHRICAFVTDLLVDLPNTAEGVCD